MASITKDQVLHNIKEAYLAASGDTDKIDYGNISTKVYDAISSSGGISATVDILSRLTFIVTER